MTTTAHEDQFMPAPVEVSALKPCAHCGSEVLIGQTLDDAWYAMCCVDHCIRIDKYWRTKTEAIAAWNTRTASAPADLVELVTILHQYRSDMLRPPAPDSRERRIAMIDAALAKHVKEPHP